MIHQKTFLGLIQNMVMMIVATCSLVTWFIYPSCSTLSSWLLIQGVSTLASAFLLLTILCPTIAHIQRHGSLDTLLLTNLVISFIVLMVIAGFIMGWTFLGSFLFISAWSGNIKECKVDDGRQVKVVL